MKKVSYVPWLGTPMNDEIFHVQYKESWEYNLKEKLAENGFEIHTNDILKVVDSDKVVFFDNLYYKNLNEIWKLYKSKKLHKTVYIDYEPPSGHCRHHSNAGLIRLSKLFGTVITYNDEVINGENILKGNIANFFGKTIKEKVKFKDKKLVCMITNNTGIEQIRGILNFINNSSYYTKRNFRNHKNQIYNKRYEAAKFFTDNYPDEFDLYGTYWGEEFNYVLKGYLDKKEKRKKLSQYKFIISYDSIINQKGYISEKIFDAFNSKVIPIYWGASNISEYIPEECYIDKRDFHTYEDLYQYISTMSEIEYEKRIRKIESFLNSEKYKELFSGEASANIIYQALQKNNKSFSYETAYKELKRLQKQKNKIDMKKTLHFYYKSHAIKDDKIILNIGFEYNDYQEENLCFYVKSKKDGFKKVETENIVSVDQNMVTKRFSKDYELKGVKTTIEIFIKQRNKFKKIILGNSSPKNINITNYLTLKKNNKKINVITCYNKNKICKFFWLLKYNPRHFVVFLNQKLEKWRNI